MRFCFVIEKRYRHSAMTCCMEPLSIWGHEVEVAEIDGSAPLPEPDPRAA